MLVLHRCLYSSIVIEERALRCQFPVRYTFPRQRRNMSDTIVAKFQAWELDSLNMNDRLALSLRGREVELPISHIMYE